MSRQLRLTEDLDRQWEEFKDARVAPDCPKEIVSVLREAFYAGAGIGIPTGVQVLHGSKNKTELTQAMDELLEHCNAVVNCGIVDPTSH